jgi:hypothetical protein
VSSRVPLSPEQSLEIDLSLPQEAWDLDDEQTEELAPLLRLTFMCGYFEGALDGLSEERAAARPWKL